MPDAGQTHVASLPLCFAAWPSTAISKSAELQTVPQHSIIQTVQPYLFAWSYVVNKWLFYGSVHISACESKELPRQAQRKPGTWGNQPQAMQKSVGCQATALVRSRSNLRAEGKSKFTTEVLHLNTSTLTPCYHGFRSGKAFRMTFPRSEREKREAM